MAIVRFSNVLLNDPETMVAFYEAFPNAKEIPLPNGAQEYKLFEANGTINGKELPDNDNIIVLHFHRNGGRTKIAKWEPVWYNNVEGKQILKNLRDMNIC